MTTVKEHFDGFIKASKCYFQDLYGKLFSNNFTTEDGEAIEGLKIFDYLYEKSKNKEDALLQPDKGNAKCYDEKIQQKKSEPLEVEVYDVIQLESVDQSLINLKTKENGKKEDVFAYDMIEMKNLDCYWENHTEIDAVERETVFDHHQGKSNIIERFFPKDVSPTAKLSSKEVEETFELFIGNMVSYDLHKHTSIYSNDAVKVDKIQPLHEWVSSLLIEPTDLLSTERIESTSENVIFFNANELIEKTEGIKFTATPDITDNDLLISEDFNGKALQEAKKEIPKTNFAEDEHIFVQSKIQVDSPIKNALTIAPRRQDQQTSRFEGFRSHDVNTVNIITIRADNKEQLSAEFSGKVIPANRKDEMVAMKVVSKNPNEIINKCLDHLPNISFEYPPCFVVVPQIPTDMDPSAASDFSRLQQRSELTRYGELIVFYAENSTDADEFLQDISTGGNSLMKYMRKSKLKLCLSTILQDVYFSSYSLTWLVCRELGSKDPPQQNVKIIEKSFFLMISNTVFSDSKLNRIGGDAEEQILKDIATITGSTFKILSNQKKAVLLTTIRKELKNHFREDAIFMLVSSHGGNGFIRTVDGEIISIEALSDIVKEEVQENTLVYILIAACQDDREGVTRDVIWPTYSISNSRRNTIVVSPFPGSVNVRDLNTGSLSINQFGKCVPGTDFYKRNLIEKFPTYITIDDLIYELSKQIYGCRYEDVNESVFEMLMCRTIDTTDSDFCLPVKSRAFVTCTSS